MKVKAALFLFCGCFAASQTMAQSMSFGSEFQNGQNVSFEAQIKKVKPSEKYLKALKTCYPYSEEYSVNIDDEKIKVKYEILGLGKTRACRLVNDVKAIDGYSITRCSLKQEQLKKFADALYSLYSRNNFNPPENPSDADLADIDVINSVIEEKNTCFKKFEYDNTKELREKLVTCTPYAKRSVADGYGMEYKIIGKVADRDFCMFSYSRYLKMEQLPGITQSVKNRTLQPKDLRDTVATYSCLLSKFNIEELKLAFEKLKIFTNEMRDRTTTPPYASLDKLLKQFEETKVCALTGLKQ